MLQNLIRLGYPNEGIKQRVTTFPGLNCVTKPVHEELINKLRGLIIKTAKYLHDADNGAEQSFSRTTEE